MKYIGLFINSGNTWRGDSVYPVAAVLPGQAVPHSDQGSHDKSNFETTKQSKSNQLNSPEAHLPHMLGTRKHDCICIYTMVFCVIWPKLPRYTTCIYFSWYSTCPYCVHYAQSVTSST